MASLKPITLGTKYARLTLIEDLGMVKKVRKAIFTCECGNKVEKNFYRVSSGHTKSCGCYLKISACENGIHKGLSKTPIYNSWSAMMDRCYNKKSRGYAFYGAIGIKVCKNWHRFLSFHEWAIKHGHENGLTIERKNPRKNYNPNNCTWIPKSLQPKNTKRGVYLTFKGKTMDMADWAKELGIKHGTIRSRWYRNFSVENILNKKSMKSPKNIIK